MTMIDIYMIYQSFIHVKKVKVFCHTYIYMINQSFNHVKKVMVFCHI